MNKICTSLEQSKKLIELGIDVNTADMMWDDWSLIDDGWHIFVDYDPEIEQDYGRKCYPAWSLSALLKLMPFHIIKHNIRYGISFWKGYNSGGDTYCYEYISNEEFKLFGTKHHNDPLDAAFEMVCWLKENGEI